METCLIWVMNSLSSVILQHQFKLSCLLFLFKYDINCHFSQQRFCCQFMSACCLVTTQLSLNSNKKHPPPPISALTVMAVQRSMFNSLFLLDLCTRSEIYKLNLSIRNEMRKFENFRMFLWHQSVQQVLSNTRKIVQLLLLNTKVFKDMFVASVLCQTLQ